MRKRREREEIGNRSERGEGKEDIGKSKEQRGERSALSPTFGYMSNNIRREEERRRERFKRG